MSSDWYTRRYTKAVSEYDSYLYADRLKCGAIGIFRKTAQGPHLAFALTKNWVETGEPVYWGVEVVMNRLKAHDLWKNGNVHDEIAKEHERDEASAERARQNSVESFLLEFRKSFAKTFNDYNTSTMAKADSRRLGEKKYGNRKS